jgi:hypothetical protein
MTEVKKVFEILESSTGAKTSTQHKLIYDSPTETLEPIYFFILDLMNDFGIQVEKLVDNFVSSPGSAHFGEMGQRASIMQQQGAKLMGDINTVLRSVLNLVYDLREYKIMLQSYEDLKSKDENTQRAARLSLKQRWMDKVDMQKGNSSIKAMALSQSGFNTLIDAFLVCNSIEDVDKLDLNDIVKRILKPRVAEFNHWINYSESELLKRYEIEKTYLRSQVDSLKLYSSWAKPYLRAAQQLNMAEGGRHPALVKMFNTMLLELTLLGKRKFDSTSEWSDEKLGISNIPKSLKKLSGKRNYFEIVLVDFNFRGIPQRTQQGGYVAGGKTEITFRGYALTDEQLQKFYDEFDKSDITDALSLIDGITKDSLDQLTEDIDFFLYDKEPEEKEEKKEKKVKDESNPFLALIGAYNKKEKKPKEEKKKEEMKLSPKEQKIERDYIMPALTSASKDTTFSVFEIYKKAHGMAAFP